MDFFSTNEAWQKWFYQEIKRFVRSVLDEYTDRLSVWEFRNPAQICPGGSDGWEAINAVVERMWETRYNAVLRGHGESSPGVVIDRLPLERRMTAGTRIAYYIATQILADIMVKDMAKKRRQTLDGMDVVMWDDIQADQVFNEVFTVLHDMLRHEEAAVEEDVDMPDWGGEEDIDMPDRSKEDEEEENTDMPDRGEENEEEEDTDMSDQSEEDEEEDIDMLDWSQ